jgi:cytochrome P450
LWLIQINSVAGSETTATLLSGLTNHLLRNPDIFDRLKKEIRDSIKKQEDLVIANLINLPFMNACIEEGLRIFPPVPVGLLRTVPAGGSDIDGHMIPGGVSCTAFYEMPRF